MNCRETRALFSPYLDGMVTGTQMRAVNEHFASCLTCKNEFESIVKTQSLVSSLGRKQAPPELALRLKVALSQERERTTARWLEGYVLRFQNAMSGLMFPATTAGVASLVLFLMLFVGVNPPIVRAADSADVPTALFIPAKLAHSPFPAEMSHHGENPILVETLVGADGRVQDYRIVSGQDSEELRREVARALIFTEFEPARSFGRPVADRVVLSFGNVEVRDQL